jgi:hypothetical protein
MSDNTAGVLLQHYRDQLAAERDRKESLSDAVRRRWWPDLPEMLDGIDRVVPDAVSATPTTTEQADPLIR